MNQKLVTQITEDRLHGVTVDKPFLKNKLGLPDYFRFGFELEALIDARKIQMDMEEYTKQTKFNYTRYKGVEEATVEYEENEYGGYAYYRGGEIVTPILSDSEDAWKDLETACIYLQENAECTSNCSVHINIGTQALGNHYQNWYNFLKIIASCEPEIYRYLCNGKEIRYCAIGGGFRNRYAMPIAEDVRKGLAESDSENVQDLNILLNNCYLGGEYQTRKDKSISLKELYITSKQILPYEKLEEPAYGRRIEIRMPNGTFDPVLIQQYTYFIGRIFELARNLNSEKNQKLDALLQKELPNHYNEPVDITRALDVANILFDEKEDKLQFIYTILGKEKTEKIFTSKEEILQSLREENMILAFVPEAFRSDRDIIIEAVKHGGDQLQYASSELKEDKNIVLTAVRQYGRALQYTSENLQTDRNIVLEAVKQNGFAIQFASQELQADREVAFEAVKSKAYAIQYISLELQDDKEIALEAVKKDGLAIQFISERLKSDKDIGLAAVNNNRISVTYLNENVMLDKDVLLIVYDRNEFIHHYLETGELPDDEDFAYYLRRDNLFYKYLLKEVMRGNTLVERDLFQVFEIYRKNSLGFGDTEGRNQYSSVIEYILSKIKSENNQELLCKFLSADGEVLDYLSEEEKDDKHLVLIAITGTPLSLEYASERLRGDREVVLIAVRKRGLALMYATPQLQDDETIVLEAVRKEGSAVKYASKKLREKKEIAIEAIREDAGAIYDVDKKLRKDRDVVIELMKKDGAYLENVDKTFQNDKEVVLTAIRCKAFAIEFASEELQDDKEIGLEVMKRNGYLLRILSTRLRNDREIVLAALKNTPSAIEYASEELQVQKEELMRELANEKEGEERIE